MEVQFEADPNTGALTSIVCPGDPEKMNWIGGTQGWGTPVVFRDGQVITLKTKSVSAAGGVYVDGDLRVEVERSLDAQGHLQETYKFQNTGSNAARIDSGSLGIRVPFVDNYEPGAALCCRQRCHAHLWPEGSSAWVCLLRMGTTPPHLGLVLTSGQLDGYSIIERPWQSNDRGVFVIHPVLGELPAGGSAGFSWKIFRHNGWEDFFAKAKSLNPAFVRLTADKYAAVVGEEIQITAPADASLRIDGQPAASRVTFDQPGEHLVEWVSGDRREVMWLLATEQPDVLLKKRAKFLIEKKQVRDVGHPYDGTFLIYDLETGRQFVEQLNDHNPARERLGSGVLIGLLALRESPGEWRSRLEESFQRYYRFLNREIQDDSGYVHNNAGYSGEERLYNWPFALQAHLVAWELTQDKECLNRFLRALRLYHAKGGEKFYAICIPIEWSLTCLESAGMLAERAEALGLYRRHADSIIATGLNIPAHEVKYEQSIMGPALQIVAETAVVTGDSKYKEAVAFFLPLLEAFHGRQPHYRLHDIGLRHWDGFWFGKYKRYGDTMPHYWSTISALGVRLCARLGYAGYAQRAHDILLANFANFGPNGEGYCAYLFPRTINGMPGRYNDPYDNDQDWALINWLHFSRKLPL